MTLLENFDEINIDLRLCCHLFKKYNECLKFWVRINNVCFPGLTGRKIDEQKLTINGEITKCTEYFMNVAHRVVRTEKDRRQPPMYDLVSKILFEWHVYDTLKLEKTQQHKEKGDMCSRQGLNPGRIWSWQENEHSSSCWSVS